MFFNLQLFDICMKVISVPLCNDQKKGKRKVVLLSLFPVTLRYVISERTILFHLTIKSALLCIVVIVVDLEFGISIYVNL